MAGISCFVMTMGYSFHHRLPLFTFHLYFGLRFPQTFSFTLLSITNVCALSRRTGFNRQADGNTSSNNQQRPNGSPNPSPTSFSPVMPPPNQSLSSASVASSGTENGVSGADAQVVSEPIKYFFQEKYAKLGVKGNFMPLAAQPPNVELADWLAHQSRL